MSNAIPNKTEILETPVSDFVPHSDPMVLLNRIVDFTDNQLIAEVDISSQSRFFDTAIEGIESWVSVEYMAQAVAALAGVRSRLKGETVKLGFLLGTRKMELLQPIMSEGKTYSIEVEELFMDDSGLGAFRCLVKLGQTTIAQAKLNVFETNDEDQLLS